MLLDFDGRLLLDVGPPRDANFLIHLMAAFLHAPALCKPACPKCARPLIPCFRVDSLVSPSPGLYGHFLLRLFQVCLFHAMFGGKCLAVEFHNSRNASVLNGIRKRDIGQRVNATVQGMRFAGVLDHADWCAV